MNLSRDIRDRLRTIPLIYNTYLIFMVFRRMPIQDIFNFKKISLFWKISPYTMVTYGRLTQAFELSKIFEERKIGGAFVECGVWRGGCAAIMAYWVNKAKSNRKIWLFDSFEGLPTPTAKDGLKAMVPINKCEASLECVEFLLFSKLKLARENIYIERGWFQDTLPRARERIGDIAILRLDGDWYESTKCCLDNLYPNVIKGGYIIIDDYDCWEGSKNAVDEFLTERNIDVRLNRIDYGGRYFQKP